MPANARLASGLLDLIEDGTVVTRCDLDDAVARLVADGGLSRRQQRTLWSLLLKHDAVRSLPGAAEYDARVGQMRLWEDAVPA